MKIVKNQIEFESVILKEAIDLLDEILSKQLFDILGSPPDQNILFKTKYYQKYFYINLVDFLSSIAKCFCFNDKKCSLFNGLLHVSSSPSLGTKESVSFLREKLELFNDWVNAQAEVEFWSPNIEKNVILKLSRLDMLQACGNISKHTVLRLDRTAADVRKIFEKSQIDLSYEKAISCLDDFYIRFHDDILNYHASYIAEMLLNIRRAINEYLKPVYKKHIIYTDKHECFDIQMYEYRVPGEIKGEVVRMMFWELMNNVRSRINWPFPTLKISRYLKMRY